MLVMSFFDLRVPSVMPEPMSMRICITIRGDNGNGAIERRLSAGARNVGRRDGCVFVLLAVTNIAGLGVAPGTQGPELMLYGRRLVRRRCGKGGLARSARPARTLRAKSARNRRRPDGLRSAYVLRLVYEVRSAQVVEAGVVVRKEGLLDRLIVGHRTACEDVESACTINLVRVTTKVEQLRSVSELGMS
jgi:hypothetical protein